MLWWFFSCVYALGQSPPAKLSFSSNQASQVAEKSISEATEIEELSPPKPQTNSEPVIEHFEFRQAPMEEVAQLFSLQSGLQLVLSEAARQKVVSVSISKMPSVEALVELTKQTGTHFKQRSKNVYAIFSNDEKDRSLWDTQSLREFENELNQAFPNSNVELSAVGSQLIVRGQAHDVVEASRIIRLIDAEAKTKRITKEDVPTKTVTEVQRESGLLGGMQLLQRTEPELSVIDMLTVLGEQQVALRVTVAEVDRSALRQIGLNFSIKDGGNTVFRSLVGPVGAGNLPAMLDNGQVQLAIEALRRLSLAKTLAEPTLTAMNGQEASFDAGGQFPVPVVSGQTLNGLQGVSFVPFGVRLRFTPFITDRDRVRLNVSAEVSNRAEDASAGATIGDTVVPGLDMRKFQTIVELREGQTLAVAGLISSNQVNQADRVPFFGDLPVVGRLAAFDRISAREQELVILVTPELVRPLSADMQPNLPGSDIFEPGDIEFYLGGHLEGTRNEDYRSPSRTDYYRQKRFYQPRDVFISGPHGYSDCGPLPGVVP